MPTPDRGKQIKHPDTKRQAQPKPRALPGGGVTLSLEDFQRVSDRVPFVADLKPSGKYVMEDVHKVGGTPAVLKYLLAKGLIDGTPMTVTGKVIRKELKARAMAEGEGER